MNESFTPDEMDRMALERPRVNTFPLPEYDYDRLDYGMTIGIERTPSGRLWGCWVGGGDNEKAYFVLAVSDDVGITWSKPCLVIDPHEPSLPFPRRTIVGNLWTDPQGRLWLFFDQSLSLFDGRAGTWYIRCNNPDDERPIWTTPVRIWHGCALNKPIVRSNGEWLLTISLWDRKKISTPFATAQGELDEYRMANVFASSDEGSSWRRRGSVAFPNPEFDEAQIIERNDSSLWMTGRTQLGLWESESTDDGKTWSTARPSSIANVNSRHHLRRLSSGRILLVKHGIPLETRPPDRSHLTAYLSDDDGATWQGGLVLDDRLKVSYPDGTQSPDGQIFVSYDYNRDTEGHVLLARFTEEDVLAGRCVSPGSVLKLMISQPNPEAVAARHSWEKALAAGL